mmetsp:Transcript_2095/g.3762  ORF Transcript_2095/g.3762 Transcript_2095/m.3762 type:complete len:195 (+) Transcript_2095:62-646(+)
MFTRSNIFVFNVWMLAVALTAVVVDAAVPANDECESALELVPSDTAEVTGSTIDATVDGINICGENLVTSPGVWYSYQQSSDSVIHVSTCTNQTNFDTALTVYTGDCSSLQCVDGRDDDLECGSDEHSTVSWQAVAGQQYYVLVHGSEANYTGDFGLVVTASEPLTVTSSFIQSWHRYWMVFSSFAILVGMHCG